MFCDQCGSSNRGKARFCRACGAALSEEAAGVEPTTTPIPAPVVAEAAALLRRGISEAYEVDRELGRGGMGRVILAREKALERQVAIKVLDPALARDAKSVERFLREARLAARLRHPGIVAIHAVGEIDGLPYFSMDFVDGATLDGHVREHGAMDGVRATETVAAIARAMGHAHAMGVVHRDLKPSNVMIDRHGHVVVLDFGLARTEAGEMLSTTGVIVGTPAYLSPEQIEGKPATPVSDLYALGLVFAFLLTGDDLVRGDTVSAVVSQHLAGVPSRLVTEEPRLACLASLLGPLLARDPDLRVGSVPRLLELLAATPPAATSALEPTTLEMSRPAEPSEPPLSPVRKEARERMRALLDRLPRRDEPS